MFGRVWKIGQALVFLRPNSVHATTFCSFYLFNQLWFPSKCLNCPCHLYGSIYHRMHNWAPPSFGIFKSLCWYGKFVFILVLSMRFVRQKKDAPYYTRPIHWKGALTPGQFSNRPILSHIMTGNRHTSFVNRLNFKSCIFHSVGFQQLTYCEYALWTRPGSTLC